MQTETKGYFFSQPHQPFFTLGVSNAIIMMLIFFISLKGWIGLSLSPLSFHAYSLIFTLFTPFFLGFLLTTFPRFSQTPPLEKSLYMRIFALVGVGSLLTLLGAFISIYILILGAIMIALAQGYVSYLFYARYQASPAPDKYDIKWIMITWSLGLLSNTLFILFLLGVDLFHIPSMEVGIYLYLIMLALSVAQRMVPFFSHIMIERHPRLLLYVGTLFALKIIADSFSLSFGFLFLLLAGALLIKEILRWNLPFKQADAILWILHLAIFLLPVGLIIGGISELASLIFHHTFPALSIHLLVLGFLVTIMIGFGTRVTLGHSGNQMRIDTATKILFYLTVALLYFRALFAFTGYSLVFDISMALWLTLFTGWAVKYFPVLIVGKKLP